jgi:adenylosuccinate lyase
LLHLGMTSSDLLDTTLALQLKEAGRLILTELDGLLAVLARRAREHALDTCIGRSHGIHAEPTTMGIKLAGFHAEFARQRHRFVNALADVGTCAVSGAVGTFASIDPRVEAIVAERLGLRPEPVSTQVIPRDRHAAFACALAQLASSIERLATEVRHLQRSEVREAEEYFHAGQKGSSAMPHKRNPVLSENLTGLARMIRAGVVPALENVVLWHERDIAHSSVERVMLPDGCILTDFALSRLGGMMDRLVIHNDRMRRNLEATQGLYNSQAVLLALVEAGMARQAAYELVQASAMQAWKEERPLLDVLLMEPRITRQLPAERLRALFDPARYIRHAAAIVERGLAASLT